MVTANYVERFVVKKERYTIEEKEIRNRVRSANLMLILSYMRRGMSCDEAIDAVIRMIVHVRLGKPLAVLIADVL